MKAQEMWVEDLEEETPLIVGMSYVDQWKQDWNLMRYYKRTLQAIAQGAFDPKKLAADALANFIPDEDNNDDQRIGCNYL